MNTNNDSLQVTNNDSKQAKNNIMNTNNDSLQAKNNNMNTNNGSDDESILDINADTETMNDQILKHIDKGDKFNSDDVPKKIIKINKEIFKTLIIEYLSLDDQIRSFKETIKDKTEEKKQYESQILELMGTLKQNIIITDKGNLERSVKESKGPLTPELIKSALTDILKCSDTANTYTDAIVIKRPTKELIALKRKIIGDTKKRIKTGNLIKTQFKSRNKKNTNLSGIDG